MHVNDYFVPFTCMDDMSMYDVIQECHKEKWSPVITIQYTDGKISVPVFRNHQFAMNFVFRNFGKKYKRMTGTIGLNKEHFNLFTDRGWEVEVLDFPKKFKDRKDASLVIEVFEIPQGFLMPNQGIWNAN